MKSGNGTGKVQERVQELAYAEENMCGKAGGQRRHRSKGVHGVKTVERRTNI